MSELRATLRQLLRTPLYALAVIAVSSMAIGLTTVTFSMADGSIFKSLPYREPASVFVVQGAFAQYPGALSRISPRDLRDWNAMVPGQTIAAFLDQGSLGRLADSLTPITAARIDEHVLDTLGVSPALGGLTRADFLVAPGPDPALVTHAVWQRLFGGKADAVDRIVEFSDTGRSVRIAGVLPAGFVFPDPSRQPDMLLPLRLTDADYASRANRRLSAVVRTPRDTTATRLQERLSIAAGTLKTDWPPGSHSAYGPFDQVSLIDVREFITGHTRPFFVAPLVAAAFVLLLACVNLGGMATARLDAHRRDSAIRRALGASAWDVARLQIGELLLLIGAGALLGVFEMTVMQPLVIGTLPKGAFLLKEPGIDGRVLACALVATFATVTLVAAIAWLMAGRREQQLQRAITGAPDTSRTPRWMDFFVSAQVAVGFALVISGVLIGVSFLRLSHRDLGFEASGQLAVEVARLTMPVGQIADELKDLPGVVQAGAIVERLFNGGGRADIPWKPPKGASARCLGGPKVGMTAHVFDVMQPRVLAGRLPTVEEINGGSPVAVITDNGIGLCWSGATSADAVGRHLNMNDHEYTIVGVIQHVRLTGFAETLNTSELFVPAITMPEYYSTFLLRTTTRDKTLPAAVAARMRQLGLEKSITSIAWLDDVLSDSVRTERLTAWAFALLGGASLIVLGAGVFGLIAQKMARRTREIGIRFALGATPRRVTSMLLTEYALTVGAGLIVGGMASMWSLKLLKVYARDSAPFDPGVWTIAAAAVLCTAIVAVLLPILRARRLSPAEVLRAV